MWALDTISCVSLLYCIVGEQREREREREREKEKERKREREFLNFKTNFIVQQLRAPYIHQLFKHEKKESSSRRQSIKRKLLCVHLRKSNVQAQVTDFTQNAKSQWSPGQSTRSREQSLDELQPTSVPPAHVSLSLHHSHHRLSIHLHYIYI